MLVLVIASTLSANSAQAQEPGVTGEPSAGGPPSVPVPVYLDDEYLGEIDAIMGDDDTVRVPPAALVSMIEDRITERVQADAKTLFPSDTPVALDTFGQLGITVLFDWDDLLIRIGIPPLARRPERISFVGRAREPTGTPVATEDLSFIANLDLWSRYGYEINQLDAAATTELVANLSGVVTEAEGGARTGDEPLFLNHLRASWDIPELGYRVQAGDLTWQSSELANVSRVTGFSLFPAPGLGADDHAAEEVLHSLFLLAESTLTVTLNESQLYDRTMAAGNYALADVPLADGLNTVVISWEMEEGARQVELVIPSDGDLLDVGRLDSGVAMGVADREMVRPVVVSYQRYGVAPWLTIGLREGVEMLDFQLDLGLEAIVASRVGTFILEPDVGIGPESRFLLDVPLRWYYLDSRPSSYLNMGLATGYHSRTVPDGTQTTTSVSASGYLNLALPEGFSVTPRVANRYTLTDGTNRFELSASLRKSIRGGSALSADVGLSLEEQPAFTATVTYSAAFPEHRQNLFVRQNLETQELFAYWNRYPGQNPQDVEYNLSGKVPISTNEVFTVDGQVGYVHPLVRGSVGHDIAGVAATGELQNATSLTIQTGLVAAGGLVTMTAPVTESFAIIAPQGALAGEEFRISRGGGQTGRVVNGGPVALTGLQPYSPVQIALETEELDTGIDEAALRYVVSPSYRSGTVIRPEEERTIYAGGRLVDQAGKPLAYRLGSWTGPAEQSGEFFTDERGYFELYGLEPGSYVLTVSNSPLRFRVTITDDAPEFVDLGELRSEEGE